MVDDLLLFSLPCFCRGAASIGAVVIRKVTEARPPSGSGDALILSGRGAVGRRREGTKLERIALVAETVETTLSRHLSAGLLIWLRHSACKERQAVFERAL